MGSFLVHIVCGSRWKHTHPADPRLFSNFVGKHVACGGCSAFEELGCGTREKRRAHGPRRRRRDNPRSTRALAEKREGERPSALIEDAAASSSSATTWMYALLGKPVTTTAANFIGGSWIRKSVVATCEQVSRRVVAVKREIMIYPSMLEFWRIRGIISAAVSIFLCFGIIKLTDTNKHYIAEDFVFFCVCVS